MPMRDRLARLVQRNPERPTLRQRAAALKASAAKVLRKPAPADATAAAAEPVAAPLSDTFCNPDAALIRLGIALEAAIAAEREACARADAAIRASAASKRESPEAEVAAEAAGTLAADLARQVAEMPAYTADGLRLKIRALIHYDPAAFRDPPEMPDPHHILARSLRHDAQREESIAALAVVDPSGRAPVALPGTDDEFLRLEREWNEAREREEAAYARQREIAPEGSRFGSAPQDMSEWREWHAKVGEWRKASGIEEAEEGAQHWCGIADDFARQIAALPATSLTGMRVKARVLQYFEEIEVDPTGDLVGGLARDVLALSPEVLPQDARALALVDAIERMWGAWSEEAARDHQAEGADVDARYKAREARRDALLAAAIDLPAVSRAERHAKALAHAWIGVVEAWQFQRPRETYKYDELLAFDIDAALAPGGMAGDPNCPLEVDGGAPAALCEAVEAKQCPGEGVPAASDLPDLSKLSIVQLRNLYDRYVQVSDLWNDALHAPWTNDADKAGLRALNAAGDLIEAEQTRMCGLYAAVVDEISKRTPSDEGFETNWQLETLIRHELMCNGDLREAPDLRAAIAERWSA